MVWYVTVGYSSTEIPKSWKRGKSKDLIPFPKDAKGEPKKGQCLYVAYCVPESVCRKLQRLDLLIRKCEKPKSRDAFRLRHKILDSIVETNTYDIRKNPRVSKQLVTAFYADKSQLCLGTDSHFYGQQIDLHSRNTFPITSIDIGLKKPIRTFIMDIIPFLHISTQYNASNELDKLLEKQAPLPKVRH